MEGSASFDFSEDALLRERFAWDGGESRGDATTQDKFDRKREEDAEGRVIAVQAGASARLSGPVAPPQVGPQVAAAGSTRIDAIIQRIEETVRASLAGGSTPAAMTIRIDDLQAFGLRSLELSMSAGRLDVSLDRLPEDLSPAAIAAAQGLAQQLAVRFPTRVVRVIDLDPDRKGAKTQQSSLRAISELLSSAGRGGPR